MTDWEPLEKLRIADPDTFLWVKGRAALLNPPLSREDLLCLVDETVWGLSEETGFGEAIAKGLFHLIPHAPTSVDTYIRLVRQAGATGATLGRIMATFLVPVLANGRRLLEPFLHTISILRGKGTYTLTAPLEVLTELLSANDLTSAAAYLDLINTTFEQPLTYNKSVRLVYVIPKAVRNFPPVRRYSQITQLQRVVKTDVGLVDPFLEGVEKGLRLLSAPALEKFITLALARNSQKPEAGAKFISLSSKVGLDTCAALQVAVPLSQVKGRLHRYLQARLGCNIALKPLADLSSVPGQHQSVVCYVCSDGRHIYLPDEIDRFDSLDWNIALYRTLVGLEAGFFECGSYDFDLEKAALQCSAVRQWMADHHFDEDFLPEACDLERFIGLFPTTALADDLFNLFEQARVVLILNHRYPGLMGQVLPIVRAEFCDNAKNSCHHHLLAPLYNRLVLAVAAKEEPGSGPSALVQQLETLFLDQMAIDSPVEAIAGLVCRAYRLIAQEQPETAEAYTRLPTPFGRRLRWDLASLAFRQTIQLAQKMKLKLAEQKQSVLRSDLIKQLDGKNRLCLKDIQSLILLRAPSSGAKDATPDWAKLDLEALFREAGVQLDAAPGPDQTPAFRYPEWNCQLQDYLKDHTRVQETDIVTDHALDFYRQTLSTHRGLVAHIRRAFELLKPEGLTLLRQWPEGDAFDYRALLDFAVDRRAGQIPSDRLFIKRLKKERDVAVLLLVDLSRSTANVTADGHATVLDVAKAALVIFCEALQVVGDTFAIAGFSGTGRHCVDYYRIKSFQDALTEDVQARISALRPQRSTRMGAAIRHATAQLEQVHSRVRLLIIVSDGFPNDLDYKSDYAIADTRRAAQEARTRNFHVKAITVNIGSDPRLDDLYGRLHHHVIGDVRELPGKLLRLYGALTKN